MECNCSWLLFAWLDFFWFTKYYYSILVFRFSKNQWPSTNLSNLTFSIEVLSPDNDWDLQIRDSEGGDTAWKVKMQIQSCLGCSGYLGVSKNRGYRQNGWWKWWKPLFFNGWFRGTPIFGNIHLLDYFPSQFHRDPQLSSGVPASENLALSLPSSKLT